MSRKSAFAVLSTNSKKFPGFPLGSIVGFAVDEQGRPFFSFSTMSAHTQNLLADGRASLCVTEAAFRGAADARVTLLGTVRKVEGSEEEALRKDYVASHEGAYWASFGDFGVYRMDTIDEVSFVGGFARAGTVTPAEYSAAAPDPLRAFADPVMSHMNQDHEDALKDYVTYLVGVEGGVDTAQMKRLDRLGFDIRIAKGTDSGVLRVPFPAEVRERKGIKEAIVALSTEAAKIKAASAPEAAAPPA